MRCAGINGICDARPASRRKTQQRHVHGITAAAVMNQFGCSGVTGNRIGGVVGVEIVERIVEMASFFGSPA